MRIPVVLLALLIVPMAAAEDGTEEPETPPSETEESQTEASNSALEPQSPTPVEVGSDDDGVYYAVHTNFNSHDATWYGGKKSYIGTICLGPLCTQ